VQIEVIHGLAIIKKASAIVNKDFDLDAKLADAIVKAADEVRQMFVCSKLEAVNLMQARVHNWGFYTPLGCELEVKLRLVH